MAFESGPYLQVAAFCEQVIEDKSGVLSLIRVVDRITVNAAGTEVPEDMPPFDLNWKLVLVLKSGEVKGSHPIKFVLELPDVTKKQAIIVSVHLEGGNRGAQVVTDFRMKMEMPGVYWVHVYFDDELLTKLPIQVIYARNVAPDHPRS